MSSAESTSGADDGKVNILSMILASNPSEVVVAEVVTILGGGDVSPTLVIANAMALGGLEDGHLYTRAPTMFLEDPVTVTGSHVLAMGRPSPALVRLYQRLWAWWGNKSLLNDKYLDKFRHEPSDEAAVNPTDKPTLH